MPTSKPPSDPIPPGGLDSLGEEDVVGGDLAPYKALYVCGPNLLSAAAGPIA